MLKFTFLAMKRAVQIADIADFGNDGDAQARTFIAVTAARSVVMVPMLKDDAVLGVITIGRG